MNEPIHLPVRCRWDNTVSMTLGSNDFTPGAWPRSRELDRLPLEPPTPGFVRLMPVAKHT